MGLTGELVKNVFSRSRSAAAHESINGRHMERRRWSSVRSYLCGDEFNSVAAEEDSASVKSSEATVVQPLPSGLPEEDDVATEDFFEKNNSMSNLFNEEDAAIVIQTAFRRFLARRRDDHEERRSVEEKDDQAVFGVGSPSKDSISTSIEVVQTADSVKAFSVVDESLIGNDNHRAQHRSRTQQLLRTKEDWDGSTVSSNVSKMRVRHRLEAMTRRERALAYAFSQQLRICSKKRQAQSPDVGWSWLERWMATRVPDKNKDIEPLGPMVVRKRLLDLAGEEKESCGSNSVSVYLDYATEEGENNNTNKITIPTNRRTLSRRKSATKRQCQRVHAKISKKDSTKEVTMHKRNKQGQMDSKEQNQFPDTESENPESTEQAAW